MSVQILIGDVREQLRTLPEASVHCCITSPPYWSLRDYGTPPQIWQGDESCDHQWGDSIQVNATNHTDKRRWNHTRNGRDEEQPPEKRVAWLRTIVDQGNVCEKCGAWRGSLGLEPTPELYVQNMVAVFREVWRVLREDGTLWLNIGDSYCAAKSGGVGTASTLTGSLDGQLAYRKARSRRGSNSKNLAGAEHDGPNRRLRQGSSYRRDREPTGGIHHISADGLKPKDLVGIPWMLALALRNDGWCLRSDIPWVKRSSMPESVTDRPAKSLEYVFLLTKSERYYFDMQAVRKASTGKSGGACFGAQTKIPDADKTADGGHARTNGSLIQSRKLAGKEERAKYDLSRNFRNGDLWFESIAAPHGLCGIGDELVGLDVNTEPTPEAHFATFPRRLVEPFVKAGSSEAGCCPTCGKPWERIIQQAARGERVDYEGKNAGQEPNNGHKRILAAVRGARAAGGEHDNPFPAKITLGWQPSCACPPHDPIPCTVLDPFGGSGTVGLVAEALGRNSILIELNPAYVEIARKRIARGYGPPTAQPVATGQKELFA